jgi:hypothetical protein
VCVPRHHSIPVICQVVQSGENAKNLQIVRGNPKKNIIGGKTKFAYFTGGRDLFTQD